MGIEELLSIVKDYAPKDKEFIIRAYEFASEVHRGVKRKSGEPYIIHPIAVACITARMYADVDTIVACILHDVIEDGDITKDDLARIFNPTVAMLVDGVSKLPKFSINNSKIETDNFNLSKLFRGLVTDIRIIIIKLADRLHNMRTLEFHTPEKQIENARETKSIYVRLAALIGAYRIKQELDDYSFKYLDPIHYQEMQSLITKLKLDNFDIIEESICGISQLLNSRSVPFEVKLRIKSLYSLYEKLQKYETYNDIHDIFSINFILNDVNVCYMLNNEISDLYPIIPSKSKDYIAKPKHNLYSALHTSIFARNNHMLQFQVTTKERDFINTHGLTAFWELQKFNYAPKQMQENVSKMPFYCFIKELFGDELDNSQINKEVTEDILAATLTIYTPSGDIIELPAGSTPIDFAYKIHEDIGNWITGACVNGVKVRLDHQLRNRDIVQIEFSKDFIGPRENFETMCKTNRAKRKIKELRNRKLK